MRVKRVYKWFFMYFIVAAAAVIIAAPFVDEATEKLLTGYLIIYPSAAFILGLLGFAVFGWLFFGLFMLFK